MNKETLRMQMLAGIITESQFKKKLVRLNENTLKRNQDYFQKLTLLKDPNLGRNTSVSSPFTIEKISQSIFPLISKTGVEEDPSTILPEFNDWLRDNMGKYDIFNQENLNAREIFDQVYGDFIFETNELEDGGKTDYHYQDDEFQWNSSPAKPQSLITDLEDEPGKTMTKADFWDGNITGVDPEESKPNYGHKNPDGTWTFIWDVGESKGFIEGEDFIIS